MNTPQLETLLKEIRQCRHCEEFLLDGCRPVLQASSHAKILVVGQAPGRKVHATGIPFNDPSGDRLRDWMGISREVFYDSSLLNIVPMGFCYPGTGKSGDLPPRPECAELWRARLLAQFENTELLLVIGQYAIDWHIGPTRKKTLTETVLDWRKYWPSTLILPHPSPRNNLWLKRNPWFEEEVIPELRKRVASIVNTKK
ncbi:uracil-DNA glycosylase family protein [Sneathiella glossodoripedis]|uniref:uracil-DNA glycosylase family protein n=1 Tax=Sneathiella glossodoripedis TaxID=418853 RepID=UPI000472A081|nr:uracil-DNA glycosylase family protein [Sneathiella glossodoripedis]